MKCLRCQQENPKGQQFCGDCGTPLPPVGQSAQPAPSYAALHRSLIEALEQQTAASQILRVISSSPTDVQPIFEAIAESAARLCEAFDVSIFRVDGDRLTFVAHRGPIAQRHGDFSLPLVRGTVGGRSMLESRTIQVADLQNEDREFPDAVENARRFGFRTILSVPLLREGVAIGGIQLRRTEVQLFTDQKIALLQTFADQAVIAIENVRLFTELEARNRDLAEALDQQTATAEILGVISSSPTDLQPVFDTIVRNAVGLCGAEFGGLQRIVGGNTTLDAQYGVPPEELAILQRDVFPLPISRANATGRSILDRAIVHIRDIREDPDFRAPHLRMMQSFRTILAVPMLREGVPIGALALWRRDVQPFTQREIRIVRTFADQAVIAIENVRLFKELEARNRDLTEALDQQTATSEVLKVISRSAFDLQPVFDTMAESAVRLCGAERAFIFRFDGELLRAAASFNVGAEVREFVDQNPIGLGQHSISARAALERRTVHIPDVQADPAYAYALRDVEPIRTILAVPMLKGDELVGTITIYRLEIRPFTDQQVALVETFADQAVIAIENVRLFKETKEALEQQTATAEILRVISSSPTDVQPVFDAIVQSAVRLCEGLFGTVLRLDGDRLHLAAHHNLSPAGLQAYREHYPVVVSRRETVASGVILDRRVVQVIDSTDQAVPSRSAAMARATGFRGVVAVPMLRDGEPIGVINVARQERGPFTDRQVALLQTFADQAVIAIENVRLFKELEARTYDLTRSVDELRALGEVGQAINSTLDLQTVLSTIVARATELSDTDAGVIYEYDEQREIFVPRATERLEAEIVETMLATPVQKGEGATGRLAEVQEPIQVPDILAAPAESRVRSALVRAGYRALLAVPLVREEHLIGGLTVIRKATGAFPPEVVGLLRTLATQSALAIQNARLFLEIEDKSRQLEVASQHKSEFLANMSHELRTPLNAVIGFSEVLGERMFGELNDKQSEYIQDINASGTHLLSLINDILDLSKIEAGRMDLEVASFHLPQAIENALVLVRERALRRGITLQQSIDPHLGEIQGDERKVKQVLLNLLSNAIKFTPEGGRVDVRAHGLDEHVEVAVTDTGVGIAPDDHQTVFEEFRQVGAVERKGEGTGLGLALARKFIELHGGRIWVVSEVGVGSTFTFTLPVRRNRPR